MFGLHLHWSTVPLASPRSALALLAFLPFGLLFAALTLVIKQGNVGTSWLIALMALTGGVYFPTTVLPRGWRQTAACSRSRRRPACFGICSSTARRRARSVRRC